MATAPEIPHCPPVTIHTLLDMKRRGEKIAMLTGFDFPIAKLLDETGVDVILVGDSLGMAVMGNETPLAVTIEDIIYHTRAVARARERALIVADMPFMSYQVNAEQAAINAGRLMSEGNAHAVKLEGGKAMLPQVEAIGRCGIPVMGHLGLTPQSVHKFGGFKVQARDEVAAQRLLDDALALQDAGVFSVVLECVPMDLAAKVTEALSIPTIGIGAGNYTDGQVLVTNDMLGVYGEFKPKFVKRYADLESVIRGAVGTYIAEVKERAFPDDAHSFH